jgi:hypothetical protein
VTPESVIYALLALGILGAHIATLRLLAACKHELTDHMTVNHQRAELSAGHLEEVVRIGSDVADALEGLVVGFSDVGSPPSPVMARPPSLQDTMIQLMVDRFLGGSDGGTTGQEWTVHQEQATTTNDVDDESTTTDSA